ncbi:MAG: iron ABC transporter permease [Nitratireductor sp.]|nr:iron ABC transporter permease [Nitratireductor sp.]
MTDSAADPTRKNAPDRARGAAFPPADFHPAFAARQGDAAGARLAVIAIVFIILLPILALAYQATGDSAGVWPHLISYVLPSSVTTTLILLAGVGLGTLAIGTVTAWLVSRYRFPLSGVFSWALVLPLATPTYLVAYTWVEFSDYTGPVQGLVRALFGYSSSRDYWFPDIRSTGGAIFLLSLVLFPYVYLPARLTFLAQGHSMLDVARVLGAGPFKLFFRVALPAARPAVAVGMLLALMETLNDIGAVEYLGVRTVTFSVFDTWLNRSSLAGAAQLSLALLAFVVLLTVAERHLRRQQAYFEPRQSTHGYEPQALSGWRGLAAMLVCLAPIAAGFAVPVFEMVASTLAHPAQLTRGQLLSASLNSVAVACGTAIVCVATAFVLIQAKRLSLSPVIRWLTSMTAFGYAVPGTVLAIGVLTAFTAFDNQVSALWQSLTGERSGLLLSGSMAIVIFACSVRFLAMATGNIEAGYARLTPNLAAASRALGRTATQTVMQVELPILTKTLALAGLLVLVETMKELSATLLLRPFNFDTLATYVYTQASRALFEQAAFAALLIVLIGLVPVYVLTRIFISGHLVGARRKKNTDPAGSVVKDF